MAKANVHFSSPGLMLTSC